MGRLARVAAIAFVVFGVVFGAAVDEASAALRSVTLTYLVVRADPQITTVHVGDQFVVSYTLDDATVDGNAATGLGQFPGMFTAFTVTAGAPNTGTWTPSGDTFNIAGGNYVTEAGGNHIVFQIRSTGSGFPGSGDGTPFFDFGFDYIWPSGITDSGAGQTFAAQLGGAFDVPPATNSLAQIRFTVPASSVFETADMIIIAGSGVPAMPPAGFVLLMCALLALAWTSAERARRRTTAA